MYIVHGINTVLLSRGLQIDKVKAERCPCVCGSQVNTSHMSICRFMEVSTKTIHTVYIYYIYFLEWCILFLSDCIFGKFTPFFGPKREIFWFFDLENFWDCLFFAFLSFTRIFWWKLSIFQFNLFVICFSNMFNEIFTNSANFTLFWSKKGDFLIFRLRKILRLFISCFFWFYKNFLMKIVYFSI